MINKIQSVYRLRLINQIAMNKAMENIRLEIGMKVKIKNDTKEYQFNAGSTKTITAILPDFGRSRAFGLDGDTGIWCIEDFQYCVDYPDKNMV